MLPTSFFTLYLIEHHIPLATIQLPAQPATRYSGADYIRGKAYTIPAEPARTVPVILPLYNAHAYPEHYYTAAAQSSLSILDPRALQPATRNS